MKTPIRIIQISLRELRESARAFGYVVRITPLPSARLIEAYPVDQPKAPRLQGRDEKRYLLLQEIRAAATSSFTRELDLALAQIPEAQPFRASLILWFQYHGVIWREKIFFAWYDGNYGFVFSRNNVSSDLQSLRNTCGRELMKIMAAAKSHHEKAL